MIKRVTLFFLIFIVFMISACSNIYKPTFTGPFRTFLSSFESEGDFSAFYTVPAAEYDSFQELSTQYVVEGDYSHKASILRARATTNDGPYLPHRAYLTVQLQKSTYDIYRTPSLVTLMVYLDMTLVDRPAGSIDDWFSFITLSPDASDNWTRTVLVNVTPDGYARLVHVPNQGEQEYIYQVSSANDSNGSLKFPYRTWVRFDVYIDFDETHGYAKVWQDGVMISHANVKGGVGGLAQAHFGLYAAAAIDSGFIVNDKLRIQEVANEAEALTLINTAYTTQ